ncbi:MAG: histidine phosphatase family protein, partial [Chloroflexi bacterium]|nr:histidine phosphatase family protein [Chloroflexota bacterium]
HGLTAHTNERLSGWLPGISLSEEGLGQAQGLAERMSAVKLDAIYASPLERCAETARPLASSKRLRVRIREELGEVRYGDWEGKRLRTLAKTTLWRQVMASPSRARFPGGETIAETQARSVGAIEALAARHARGAVAVVTHADVIRVLVAYYAGIHLDLYQRLVISPVSISVLWVGQGTPRVLAVNDTGTLDGYAGPPKRKKSR